MGTDRPRYRGDQAGAGRRGEGGGYGGGENQSRRERESRGGADNGDIMIW